MGTRADEAKLAAEIQAACIGRAQRPLIDAQLIAHVRGQSVVRAELLGHLHGQVAVETSLHVDHGQLGQLGLRLTGQLALFGLDVGLLGVALRAHRHVLARGHGHRPRHQACHAGDEDGFFRGG